MNVVREARTVRELIIYELGLDMATLTATELAKRIKYTSATVSSLLRKMHTVTHLCSRRPGAERWASRWERLQKLSVWGKCAYVGMRFQDMYTNFVEAAKCCVGE